MANSTLGNSYPSEATAYRIWGTKRLPTPRDPMTMCECGAPWHLHNHHGKRLSLMAGSRCDGFKAKIAELVP